MAKFHMRVQLCWKAVSFACALGPGHDKVMTMMQETGQHQVDPYAVTVSRRQEGNPVLKHIRNVRWRYGDIVPDYQMGLNACALFLSLRSSPALPPMPSPDPVLSHDPPEARGMLMAC